MDAVQWSLRKEAKREEREDGRLRSLAASTSRGIASRILARTPRGIRHKDVKAVMKALIELMAQELKTKGSFKLPGLFNLKIKQKPARAAKETVNPFTKKPCVFKAKPAYKTVKAIPLKKFKKRFN